MLARHSHGSMIDYKNYKSKIYKETMKNFP